MHPAGRNAVVEGQWSGKWHDSDPIDALIDPEDLTEALETRGATTWWLAAAPSYRRNVLRWITGARRLETRRARIETVAAAASRGEKVPQY